MNKFAFLLAVLLCAGSDAALASGGADLRMNPAPVNRLDSASLQRGARNFVNYCLNCHSAKYMRYQRLTDLGVDSAMIQDNLMFASTKIGDTMTAAMTSADAKAWLGVAPPDLSVVARVRARLPLVTAFALIALGLATLGMRWRDAGVGQVAAPHCHCHGAS